MAVGANNMAIGSVELPLPSNIEERIEGTVNEFTEANNLRTITARSSYRKIYTYTWDILSDSQRTLFEQAYNQTMPVTIEFGSNAEGTTYTGYVIDLKITTLRDMPPRYKVVAKISTGKLT